MAAKRLPKHRRKHRRSGRLFAAIEALLYDPKKSVAFEKPSVDGMLFKFREKKIAIETTLSKVVTRLIVVFLPFNRLMLDLLSPNVCLT